MPTTTLDDVYSEYIEPKIVKIVKIDTEGFDFQVLRGANYMLQKTYYVIVEQNINPIKTFLIDKGFTIQQLEPSEYLFAKNINILQK